MRFFVLIAATFIATTTKGQDTRQLAISDVLLNTFKIKTDSAYATGFIIEREGKTLMITARHALKTKTKHAQEISLYVLWDTAYKKITGKLKLHKDPSVDVAVIYPDGVVPKLTPLQLTHVVGVGQEALFFGFPYRGFYTNAQGVIIPLAKKAMVSGLGKDILFLDGIVNPGFSGGPLVLLDERGKAAIAGVISGYYPEFNFVENEKKKKIPKLQYHANSGILYAVPRIKIEEIIDRPFQE